MAPPPFSRFVAAADSAVLLVTVAADDERDGCLVGFHSQASIDPPRYAVWLSTANRTWTLARRADHLGVHLLADDQHDLAERFGGQTGDDVDKLASTRWEAGEGGAPRLLACSSGFVGRIRGRQDVGGDHIGVLLEPLDVWSDASFTPLRLGDVGDITPGHPA